MELATGTYISRHENVILVGPSGLGKTHLLIGLGRAACFAGYRVIFRTAMALANELELAQQELRLERLHSGTTGNTICCWWMNWGICPSPVRPRSYCLPCVVTATNGRAWA